MVLLPAPFGPRKPVTRPAWTSNERSVTACTLPKLLLSPSISTAAVMADTLGALRTAHIGRRAGPGLLLQDERGRTSPTS